MEKAEFDKFADEYRAVHATNLAISGEAPEFFAEYKMKDLAAEYFAYRGPSKTSPAVLDFGAGIGTSVPFVKKYLPQAQLTCLDVSTRSLEIGQNRFGDLARFVSFDGKKLPFPDESVDVIFSACVFHHIDHAAHSDLITEFYRVLVPDGMLLIFEHNPYNPLTVKTVNECPFDENAHLIPAGAMRARIEKAGFGPVRTRFRIFFPRMLSALRPLEKWMTWLPFGAQYYSLAIK